MAIKIIELSSEKSFLTLNICEQHKLKGGLFSIFGLGVTYNDNKTEFNQNLTIGNSSIAQNGNNNQVNFNYSGPLPPGFVPPAP